MYHFQSDADVEPLDASALPAAPVAPIVATDGERLMRFRRHQDEAALAEVVEAHAPMVWGVCSQVLRHRQDIEDAFQATFLILARKAGAIRAADSAAGWLYRVAFRTSLLVRHQRRRRAEQPLVEEPPSGDDQLASLQRSEQCLTLLEELHALPQKYREPLVLCYFEGKSRREAADELGVTAASVKGRMARGTRMLRSRLVRRGAALSTAMAATSTAIATAQAAAPPTLAASTTALASGFATKSTLKSVGGAAKGSAAVTLAEKGILAMTIAAAAKPAAVLIAVCLTTTLLTVAAAEKPAGASAAAAASPVLLAEAASPADDAARAEAAEDSVEVQPSEAATKAPEPAAQPEQPPAAAWTDNPFADPRMAVNEPVQQGAEDSEASNEAVQLEIEYWNLKAMGLEKKADALITKAKVLQEAGRAPQNEILEMEAEAMLTQAEVKLCQSNSLRLKEALQRREERRTAEAAAPATRYPATQPAVPARPLAQEELAKLKKENAALKKQLEAGEKANAGKNPE